MANQAMINQPTGVDNLKVKEQGRTKILLTASSNQIEVHDLKKGNFRCTPASETIVDHGYVRGRGQNVMSRPGKFGAGWFHWRDWKVDYKFMVGFSEYTDKLVNKHNPQDPKIDNRISALTKERKENTENPATTKKIITFFAEVYVKYLYIRMNFQHLPVNKVLDILRAKYTLENNQFAEQIRIVIQQLESSGPKVVIRGTQASPPPSAIADHDYGQQQQIQNQYSYQYKPSEQTTQVVTRQPSTPQLRSAPAESIFSLCQSI